LKCFFLCFEKPADPREQENFLRPKFAAEEEARACFATHARIKSWRDAKQASKFVTVFIRPNPMRQRLEIGCGE
jgi:hypothetical protein